MKKWNRIFTKFGRIISDYNPFLVGCVLACAYVGILIILFDFSSEHVSFYKVLKDWGSFFAAIVALFLGIGGEWIKEITCSRPKIELHGLIFYKIRQTDKLNPQNPINITFIQQNNANSIDRDYYRLMIYNDSATLAKKIQVRLEEIWINGTKQNFIPTPFRWTHVNENTIDIYPQQLAYLDFIFAEPQNMSSPFGAIFILHELLNNLPMVQINHPCNVKIVFYGENIKPKNFWLKIDYSQLNGVSHPILKISRN